MNTEVCKEIIRKIERVEITPESLERDWCWLSVKYGFGNQWISLADILAAKKEMMDRNAQVVREFQMATKKTGRDFMKNAEARERTSESEKADALLDKI